MNKDFVFSVMEFSLNLQTNKHFLLWNRNTPG